MKFNIRGENVEVTPALREYAQKKLSRLKRYFDEELDLEVNVTLKVRRDGHGVEVTIPMPRLLLRAEEKSGDMYASVDLVVEKLERQIRKYKTKINRKLRQDGSVKQLVQQVSGESQPKVATEMETEADGIDIVRVKRFNLKPMDAEEAVLQMDLLGHNFFVFSDAETNKVSVVYKRKDGRYGLIQPE